MQHIFANTHHCCQHYTSFPILVLLFRYKNNIGPHTETVNPLKPELNPICYLLALLAHHFLHVSRIRVKSLTLR